MGKKETLSSVFNLSEVGGNWYSSAKRIAAWYIDTSENLAKEGLSLQEKSTSWAKDTPLAAFFEARNALAQQMVENSASFARSLWQIDKEEDKGKRSQA
jgi:hypothetical protein